MKIVFAYHAFQQEYGLFGHYAKKNSTWSPLNIALLSAICEQHGYEAEIIDAEALGINNRELVRRAVASKPDVIGLTAYSPFFHLVSDIAKDVKVINPDIPVIVGGPHITIMKEQAFKAEFDFAFMGEAERSLPEFLAELGSGRDFAKVGGLIYRQNGQTISTGDPAWLTEVSMRGRDLGKWYPLDELPLPARHLLPMDRYFLGTTQTGRSHFTSIQTFRGCPWKCNFCASDAIKTTRVIMKSPRRVVEEMAQIKANWPFISHLYIVDDVLLLWPQHIREIADRMDAEGLKFTFEGSTRANTVTEELIKRLARSGLVRLSFGLETIDPVMRVTMGKKVNIADYPRSNKICADNGVEAMNSLMIGLPGETRETIRATITWVKKQKDIKQANVAIAVPYPGTEFYDQALAGTHGVELLTDDFSAYLRYGNSVTRVNGMEPKELISWQNWAFIQIYLLAPHRWWPVIRKHGFVGFLLQFIRLFRLVKDLLRDRCKSFAYPGTPI